jgi:exosortase
VVTPLVTLIALLAILILASWNSLTEAAINWQNPKYSHGYIVPVFTLCLLYLRRDPKAGFGTLGKAGLGLIGIGAAMMFLMPSGTMLSADTVNNLQLLGAILGVSGALMLVQQPAEPVAIEERWIGFGILFAGLMLRMLLTKFHASVPELYTLVPQVVGVFMIAGGWQYMRWAGPSLACLLFMFPLPGVLDGDLLGPMQTKASQASTFFLQTMGFPATREGNVIHISEDVEDMMVAEKCSGLRMLTIFMFLAYAFTLLTDRPIWERIVLWISSVPIAIAVNIVRIVVTGLLYFVASKYNWLDMEKIKELGHDMAGWFMMPLALGLLAVVYQVLAHLFVVEDIAPVRVGTASAGVAKAPPQPR